MAKKRYRLQFVKAGHFIITLEAGERLHGQVTGAIKKIEGVQGIGMSTSNRPTVDLVKAVRQNNQEITKIEGAIKAILNRTYTEGL